MIEVESHPPERRRRSTVLLAHGCCCCCCLHTVGGLAGAAFGSIRRHAPLTETLTTEAAIQAESETQAASRYAAKAYWLALALTVLVSAILAAILNPSGTSIGLLLIALFLPGGQLFASLAALIWIQYRPPARKSECLSRLGRITLWAFVGGVIGCVGLTITLFTFGR